MKLYLCRHGQYVAETLDPNCALSEEGREEINKLGESLAAADVSVDSIYHSGKCRAEQTAEILAQHLMAEPSFEVRTGIDPLDDIEPLYDEIVCWEENVLLVGHLPFMAKLLAKLMSGCENETLFAFSPGTMACLERKSVKDKKWCLNWLIEPNILLSK